MDTVIGSGEGKTRAERLTELRYLFADETPITDGHRGVGFDVDGDDVVITFQWRSDPLIYAVRASLAAETGDFYCDPGLWLVEALDTGMVRAAPRRHVNGTVELDWAHRHHGPLDWYVSSVPLDAPDVRGIRLRGTKRWLVAQYVLRPGEFLRRDGFDITAPRDALTNGTLLSWRTLNTNTKQPRTLAHAAVALTGPDATLEIVTVETRGPINIAAETHLVAMLLHDAAEAGFPTLTTKTVRPSMATLGFAAPHAGTATMQLRNRSHLTYGP